MSAAGPSPAYRYRVEFETTVAADRSIEAEWYTVHRDGDEDSIRRQYARLHELAEEGEPIRNVRLYRAPVPAWEQVPERREVTA